MRLLLWVSLSISAYAVHGTTASGHPTRPGVAACGRSYPFWTQFVLPDGTVRTCLDRGGLVTNGHLDVWVADYTTAIQLGRKNGRVGVITGYTCK